MSTSVNTGKRIAIALDGYCGLAGFTEADGKASIAFPCAQIKVHAGQTIEVDDRQWIIEKAGRSEFIRGYARIDLRPAGAA